MSAYTGRELYDAAMFGRVHEVSSLLKDHPNSVNWINTNFWTPLHTVVHNAENDDDLEIVKIFLAHPNTSINSRTARGQTPFSFACEGGKVSVVQVMLNDDRVDITKDDLSGRTPMWWASCEGNHEVIKWLIASGRNLGNFETMKGEHFDGKYYTALEIARKHEKGEVVSLLEKFLENSTQTRHELRIELGVVDELAADIFSLTIFLCDDILQLKKYCDGGASRFFATAKRLPLELQMILCRRAAKSSRDRILSKDSEPAFRRLACVLN